MAERNASKQRRQARNRQEREARAARTAAAARSAAPAEAPAKSKRRTRGAAREQVAAPAKRGTRGAAQNEVAAPAKRGATGAKAPGRGGGGSAAGGPSRADEAADGDLPARRKGFLGLGSAKAARAVRGEGSGSDSPSRRPARTPGRRPASAPSRRTGGGSAGAGRAGSSRSPARPAGRATATPRSTEPPAPRTPGVAGFIAYLRGRPGGTWVGLAFVAAVVTLVMVTFFPVYQRPEAPVPTRAVVEARQQVLNQEAKDEGTRAERLTVPKATFEGVRLLDDPGTLQLVQFGVPVLITALAVAAARRPDPSRTWMYSALALVFFVLLSPMALPSAGAMGFGAYAARREARLGAVQTADDDVGDDLDDDDLDDDDLDDDDLDDDDLDLDVDDDDEAHDAGAKER